MLQRLFVGLRRVKLLEDKTLLPRETRNYIPALISVIYVMNYASEHGIKADTTYMIDTHTIDTIQLNKPIKILT